jgi:hypothetical protein
MISEACKNIGNRCDLFEPLPSPPKIKRSTSPEGFSSTVPKEEQETDEALRNAIPGWNAEEMIANLDSYYKHNPDHPSAKLWAEFRAEEKEKEKKNTH